MSRAEHNADSPKHKVKLAKHHVKHILKNRVGKDNAISSKALANRVGLKATTIRDMVPEIRSEYGVPVASCSRGYYCVESDQEFREVMDRIEETIQTKRERQSELAKAYYKP